MGHVTIAFHDRANTESGTQHIAAASDLLEQMRTERGHTSFAMAEGFVLVIRAMGALFGGDLASAAADFASAAQEGRRDLDRALALQSLGAIRILQGEPAEAIETVRAAPVIYWFDSRAVIEAVALCAMDEADAGRACIHEFAQVARLGRLSRQANEALVGMAAVAKAEGDDEGARQQLLASVLPRNPWSIVIARFLAMQLGIGDEMGERMTKALADRGDMGRHDATAELNRLLASASPD